MPVMLNLRLHLILKIKSVFGGLPAQIS